jgi:hypothetical protein
MLLFPDGAFGLLPKAEYDRGRLGVEDVDDDGGVVEDVLLLLLLLAPLVTSGMDRNPAFSVSPEYELPPRLSVRLGVDEDEEDWSGVRPLGEWVSDLGPPTSHERPWGSSLRRSGDVPYAEDVPPLAMVGLVPYGPTSLPYELETGDEVSGDAVLPAFHPPNA